MTYQKILVDNIICTRRFHIAFDDADAKVSEVSLSCQHCGAVVFQAKDHPPAKLIRDENLVQTVELSSRRSKECFFRDTFSPTPVEK